jgi:dGTPase
MADTIAYIGRDLEDAIRLGLLDRRDIPKAIVRILGNTNGTIVYRLVTDVIQNSHENHFVAFSPKISDALKALKAFNLERIYQEPEKQGSRGCHSPALFHAVRNALGGFGDEQPFIRHLFWVSGRHVGIAYIANHSHPEIVRDYIAGMTDRYFLHQFPEHLRPVVQF